MTADKDHIRNNRSFDDEELDGLLRLVANETEQRHDAPSLSHAAYLDWLAARLREFSDPVDELAAKRIAAATLWRLTTRLNAARFGVRLYRGSPPLEHAPSARPLADVLAAASDVGLAPWVDLAAARGHRGQIWNARCEWWLEVPPYITSGGVYAAFALYASAAVPGFLHDGDTVLVRFERPLEAGMFVMVWLRDPRYVLGELISATGTSLTLRPPDSSQRKVEVMCRSPYDVGRVVARWCPHERANASP